MNEARTSKDESSSHGKRSASHDSVADTARQRRRENQACEGFSTTSDRLKSLRGRPQRAGREGRRTRTRAGQRRNDESF